LASLPCVDIKDNKHRSIYVQLILLGLTMLCEPVSGNGVVAGESHRLR
jgi:hypothetical protein